MTCSHPLPPPTGLCRRLAYLSIKLSHTLRPSHSSHVWFVIAVHNRLRLFIIWKKWVFSHSLTHSLLLFFSIIHPFSLSPSSLSLSPSPSLSLPASLILFQPPYISSTLSHKLTHTHTHTHAHTHTHTHAKHTYTHSLSLSIFHSLSHLLSSFCLSSGGNSSLFNSWPSLFTLFFLLISILWSLFHFLPALLSRPPPCFG